MALYGECDSYLIENCDELGDITIDDIKAEIEFSEMLSHGVPVPRLIAIQASKTDSGLGSWYPLYRHPADYTPITKDFTPITIKIKEYIEKKLNCKLNHALIQLYRNGDDMIGEHSDKTLDIKHGSVIVNYSVGVTRTMRLRKKDKTQIEKVDLTNNSIFVLGPETNKKWLHMIKSNSSINGERISFTFRNIATFIDDNGTLTGQGAPINKIYKLDSLDMLKAFSRENHESEYDWNDLYGSGFYALKI
jgi:alkylated DNA repair dioxygenase AlkB